MAVLGVNYEMDNGMVTGMGGLLMSKGVGKVAMAIAQKYRASYLQASIERGEADARFNELAPGRIREVFSKAKIVNDVAVLKDLDSGRVNPRQAARVEVTGAYEGKDDKTAVRREVGRQGHTYFRRVGGLPLSSPVTIEFGSRYNEGTRGNRPDFRILLNALRAQAVATVGMDLANDSE